MRSKTKYFGDKFEMLIAVLLILVTKIHVFLKNESKISIQKNQQDRIFAPKIPLMSPTLTLIGKSWKQNPEIGKSPTVFHGNKIQKNFKNPDLGTSPGVIYGNKIQAKILSTWS